RDGPSRSFPCLRSRDMSLNWFKRFSRLTVNGPRPSRLQRRATGERIANLRLQRLEDRTVPNNATIYWDGGGNDFTWNNAANWSDAVTHLDRLPGPNDDVEIDYGANDFAVVHSAGSDSIRSLTSRANLVHSGGDLSLAADSHLYGALTVGAGFGAAGNI